MKLIISTAVALCIALSAGVADARGGGRHGSGVHFSFGLPLFFGYPSYYYEPYYPRYYYPPPRYYYPPPAVYDDPLPPRQVAAAPEVSLDQAPEFIYSQELGLFVSIDIPYDMVYDNLNYYLFYSGYWYRGRTYGGPWELVTVSNLPAKLLKQRVEQIRYQRDLEVRRYEASGDKYDGQFHRP